MEKNSTPAASQATKQLIAGLLLVAATLVGGAAQTFKVPTLTGRAITTDSK